MQKSLYVGETTVVVDIVDTPALREQGLSGRAELPPGTGMLFVFEEDGVWGFWMKDMRFAIDIVWLDAEGRVVTIAHGVSPDSYPQTFYPTAPSRYVLELPAGYAAQTGVTEGSVIAL